MSDYEMALARLHCACQCVCVSVCAGVLCLCMKIECHKIRTIISSAAQLSSAQFSNASQRKEDTKTWPTRCDDFFTALGKKLMARRLHHAASVRLNPLNSLLYILFQQYKYIYKEEEEALATKKKKKKKRNTNSKDDVFS